MYFVDFEYTIGKIDNKKYLVCLELYNDISDKKIVFINVDVDVKTHKHLKVAGKYTAKHLPLESIKHQISEYLHPSNKCYVLNNRKARILSEILDNEYNIQAVTSVFHGIRFRFKNGVRVEVPERLLTTNDMCAIQGIYKEKDDTCDLMSKIFYDGCLHISLGNSFAKRYPDISSKLLCNSLLDYTYVAYNFGLDNLGYFLDSDTFYLEVLPELRVNYQVYKRIIDKTKKSVSILMCRLYYVNSNGEEEDIITPIDMKKFIDYEIHRGTLPFNLSELLGEEEYCVIC